jgi:hypothetical protein
MPSICFVCQRPIKYGPSTYEGRVVRGWGRNRCRELGSIVPDKHPHLVPALQKRGIPVQYDEKGFVVIPI